MNYTDLIKDKEKFLRSVRRTSVTLRDTGLVSNEDILDIAISEVYPRVSLILITSKAKDGNNLKPILGGIGFNKDYSEQSKEVWRVFDNSVYSEGIYRVVISLTASQCLKQIPLNSEIQLFDLAKNLEDQALADLDRIMGLISSNGVITAEEDVDEDSNTDGYPRLYISQSLNKSTITEDDFSLVVRDTARTDSVRFQESIVIPDGYIGVAWIGLTGTVLLGSVESGFFIRNGDTTELITEVLASTINDIASRGSTSVIASPNRGHSRFLSLDYRKRELYPDTDKDREKQLYFDIYGRIHYLSFGAKNLSTYFSKELISVKFFLCKDLGLPLNSYYNQRYTSLPIDGLVYGTISDYKSLDNKGPHSLFLEIGKQSAAADLLNRTEDINTFYFRILKDVEPYKSEIVFRSSSPVIDGYTNWSIEIDINDNEESIAFKVLEGLYKNHESCLLVGGMPQANAVQIIPYTKSKYETRVVADILDVPLFLEVATGTPMTPLTPYRSQSRSVVVKIVPDQTKSLNDDATAPYGANSASFKSLSKPMQNVYDRLGKLREGKEYPYRWRNDFH